MKQYIYKFSCIALVILATGCIQDTIRTDPGVPPNELCSTLEGFLIQEFPELGNNKSIHAAMFEAKALKQIYITKETPIYVTFISEGANSANTFGWYAYDSANAPTSSAQLEKKILFPHVSSTTLRAGDRLKLGDETFKPGTVVGFFLISNGWEDGVINYDKLTLYTDFIFNPGSQQQHAVFRQNECDDIVVAFEDAAINEDSDADFNDLIFTITDNRFSAEVSSFSLKNVVEL